MESYCNSGFLAFLEFPNLLAEEPAMSKRPSEADPGAHQELFELPFQKRLALHFGSLLGSLWDSKSPAGTLGVFVQDCDPRRPDSEGEPYASVLASMWSVSINCLSCVFFLNPKLCRSCGATWNWDEAFVLVCCVPVKFQRG